MRKGPTGRLSERTPARPPASLSELVSAQRSFFDSGATRPLSYRVEQLQRLKTALLANEAEFTAALAADLHKPEQESYLTEIFLTVNEINFALRNLRRWMSRQRVPTDIVQHPARSYRLAEPLGVVLVISPWNYPVQLSLIPLVGAISAGNCAIVKPSEYAPRTSAELARTLAETFPFDAVAAVEGGPPVANELLTQRFDHIFFTGGGRIARHILRAAAEHLTPVTLELGGKCPCIVDSTANIELAAKRIAFARFLNAGQTCVAPDYVLVANSLKERFVKVLVTWIERLWGDGNCRAEGFSRIVSEHHFERLQSLILAAQRAGAQVAYGGNSLRGERFIAPTLFVDVDNDNPLMQEELFGPLLPILGYRNEEEARHMIGSMPKPLAAYLFSRSRSAQRTFASEVSAGGICINDCLSQMTTTNLPFGGVGASGMGAYHGKESFRTFSHYKSVMKKGSWFDLPLRYPPYNHHKGTVALIRKLFS